MAHAFDEERYQKESQSDSSDILAGNKQHPYQSRRVALATKHGKEQQIAPAFIETLQMQVIVPAGIDTDILGTFTGEVPRPGSPSETVRKKTRLGMEESGLPLGLANEGSFGPHPATPLMLADTEFLLFIDDERDIEVQEVIVSEEVVAAQCTARSLEEIAAFLVRVQFPSHGLIVRPEGVMESDRIFKGITDSAQLDKLIRQSVAASPVGLAHIETDLRAHMNPTRRGVIARLAQQMADRLARLCPQCSTPGWGRVDVARGLPCEWCGEPTPLIMADIFGCPACSYQETHPRQDGLEQAPAAHCEYCNP